MKKALIILFLVILWSFPQGCFGAPQDSLGDDNPRGKTGVTLADQGNYYTVTVDYTSGLSHRQIGAAFASAILKAIPNYEALVDSYIAENITRFEYPEVFFRVADLKVNLDPDYQAEIEGMASQFTGGPKNIRGDGKISRDEFYLFNLFPDIVRGSQCNFIAVFGKRSATGKTILSRTLDWYGGAANQLPQIQAILIYKYPHTEICSIGYLGFLGIISGFNTHQVFAAILDSATGAPFSSLGKRSYPLDLRSALEHETTLSGTAAFMLDPRKVYTVNHLIALADPLESKMLENNFSGRGTTRSQVRRALRSAKSALNPGITWGISDAIGSVNSFLLYGNSDNHSPNQVNTKRWRNMKEQLSSKGPVVTVAELKAVAGYNHGSPGTFLDSGDLYNKMTLQIIIFQPDTFSLELFFHPKKTKESPPKPSFITISPLISPGK